MNDPVQASTSWMTERALERLLALYCRGADRGDYTLVRTLFHEDAYLDLGHFQGSPDAFVAHMQGFAPFQASQHHITNRIIEVDGDRAESESYCIALLGGLSGSDITAFIRYLNHFERRDGEWRISRHIVVWDWNRSDPSTAIWEGAVGTDQALRGRRGREDASFRELPMIARLRVS